ncbi:unnamed protein product [Psylliodes chrysocephalus]|uniref:Uncharacterized protein n=1 Tax=Psylliodes chrysocephalus TaxID=3402493 RepID=A0A9P0GB36_9CUCU|nr:unnamed protein product [Psylliodes chrysocephala]
MVFDNKLTWKLDIDHILNRCNRGLNFLKSISKTWWGANVETSLIFNRSFETSNGISQQETGQLANQGSENEIMKVTGSYKFTWEGVTYTVTYVADENGFQPIAQLNDIQHKPEEKLHSVQKRTIDACVKAGDKDFE